MMFGAVSKTEATLKYEDIESCSSDHDTVRQVTRV